MYCFNDLHFYKIWKKTTGIVCQYNILYNKIHSKNKTWFEMIHEIYNNIHLYIFNTTSCNILNEQQVQFKNSNLGCIALS